MRAQLYHNPEKERLEITIYPENPPEEIMFRLLHEKKCAPVLDATGNQPYFCRIRIALPIEL